MVDNHNILVAFDLDDTLYKECEYVASGMRYVAVKLAHRLRVPVEDLIEVMNTTHDTLHPFDRLYDYIDGAVPVSEMVAIYREHVPYLTLPPDTLLCINSLLDAGATLMIITDGRHTGQWNKIAALGLTKYVNPAYIIVSDDVGGDKYTTVPWERAIALTPDCSCRWYVGDNPRKDFYYPNQLGWETVMLEDDGHNIKTQHVELQDGYTAKYSIESLTQLPGLIFNTSCCN